MIDVKAITGTLLEVVGEWAGPAFRAIGDRLDAFELALKQLPVAERGEKGDPGIQGEPGPIGEPGPHGRDVDPIQVAALIATTVDREMDRSWTELHAKIDRRGPGGWSLKTHDDGRVEITPQEVPSVAGTVDEEALRAGVAKEFSLMAEAFIAGLSAPHG